MPNRRQYLSFTAAAITAGLAGCAGRTGTAPESTTRADTHDTATPTATTATADTTEDPSTTAAPAIARASIGETVGDDQFELTVEDVHRGVDLDGYEAAADAEFVAVSLAVRNTAQADAAANPLQGVLLRDDASLIYNPVADGTASSAFIDGSIPPGEVDHATIPFEVRTTASGLELLCDVADDSFDATSMVVFDLGSEATRSH